jgi:hypothetical protein
VLTVGIVALILAANVHWPARRRAGLGLLSFFAGVFTSELAFHALFSLTVIVALFVRAGALATRAGQLGLGLSLAAATLLLISGAESLPSHAVVERALGKLPRTLEWRRLLFPIPLTPSDVERVTDVTYYKGSGGFCIGHRRYIGLPTLHRMAARGWVCFTALTPNYGA